MCVWFTKDLPDTTTSPPPPVMFTVPALAVMVLADSSMVPAALMVIPAGELIVTAPLLPTVTVAPPTLISRLSASRIFFPFTLSISSFASASNFRRSQREQNIDTWMQAGKMLGVPIASAMFQGSDFGVAFRRTTELANYAADALEGAAASGNAMAQKVLDNSRVQQALSLVRRADVAQAQLEQLSNLDNYDLSNVTLFPTAGDPELTRQNLAMMENLQNRQQEVSVPDIGGSGSSGQDESSGGGGYQRSYTSSSGNTYVYAPNFVIYGSMDANDLRSLLDEGYEKFCEYVERYEREKRRTQYGT